MCLSNCIKVTRYKWINRIDKSVTCVPDVLRKNGNVM